MARKFFTFSFDDGTTQDRRLVDILNRYGLKGTFNLNSGLFGQKHWIDHHGYHVCHDEIEAGEVTALYQGHEVAVHTVSHPNLLHCSKQEIISQVRDDYECLQTLARNEIVGMAYPCGGNCYNDSVIETILRYTPIRYARTTQAHHGFQFPSCYMTWHPTCVVYDAALFELAEAFLALDSDEDALFYVWGHSFEFDKQDTWAEFERFCKRISGRSDIIYATNGEIYQLQNRNS